jgi:hypothetical protein
MSRYSKLMNLIIVFTWILAILASHIVTLKAVYLQGIANKMGKPLAPVTAAAVTASPAPMDSLESDLLEHVFANAAVPPPVMEDISAGPQYLAPI